MPQGSCSLTYDPSKRWTAYVITASEMKLLCSAQNLVRAKQYFSSLISSIRSKVAIWRLFFRLFKTLLDCHHCAEMCCYLENPVLLFHFCAHPRFTAVNTIHWPRKPLTTPTGVLKQTVWFHWLKLCPIKDEGEKPDSMVFMQR